ncbi:Uncharacterised protein [Chlamydia trachomatis]|nr:Uncharacterised protein [Chlamydia trachomatis]
MHYRCSVTTTHVPSFVVACTSTEEWEVDTVHGHVVGLRGLSDSVLSGVLPRRRRACFFGAWGTCGGMGRGGVL